MASQFKKRLIVCCDGTWMNSDKGYQKGLFQPEKRQPPSNVTRMSQVFKQECSDETVQIVFYQNGVGTSGVTITDSLKGGALGDGVADNIREAYSFICVNYSDGDEIVVIGYSRGAFTARSIAGLIGNIGLLTRKGLKWFHPILKDVENWNDKHYEDPYPDEPPFKDHAKFTWGGDDVQTTYSQELIKGKYARKEYGPGNPIKVKAVGVWDTVGSLGIPKLSWLSNLGIPQSTDEYKFYDTKLSDRVDYAFQALALDETRTNFSPAVWELHRENTNTVMKQVWFPGNHGNIGGGWDDQQMANLTFAWMADQLSSIGVEFSKTEMMRLFHHEARFYEGREKPKEGWLSRLTGGWLGGTPLWAVNAVYKDNDPNRPWSLAPIQASTSKIYQLAGLKDRKPGLYVQVSPTTGLENRGKWLDDTNERVHSSARTRLACKGLGLDDKAVWTCPALKDWYLKPADARSSADVLQPPAPDAAAAKWLPDAKECYSLPDNRRWVWEYGGDLRHGAPEMPEEPVGPWERALMALTIGHPDAYRYAVEHPPEDRVVAESA